MRRPWLLGGVAVRLGGAVADRDSADDIAMVLIGWCLAQLAFNAVLAAIVAVLPDQIPLAQRGSVAGVLGICLPLGQVGGTFVVHVVVGIDAADVHGCRRRSVLRRSLLFVDGAARSSLSSAQNAPPLGWLDFARSYWINPRRYPDFAWAWLSRFLLVLGTAFLNTYQPFYLIDKLGYG